MSGLNGVEDIPKAWTYALRSVRNHFPEAILAGGALRDRTFGAKVKDLDIFVHGTKDEAQDAAKMLEREGWHGVSFGYEETYTVGVSEAGITGIVDAEFPGAPPVQIIFMDRQVDQLLPLFDFGINQIAYDGTTIHRSANFIADAKAHRFRVISEVSDSQFVRIINRWARLKEKYPKWHLDLGTRSAAKPVTVNMTVGQASRQQGKTLLQQLGQPYVPQTTTIKVPICVSREMANHYGVRDGQIDHQSQMVELEVNNAQIPVVMSHLRSFMERLGQRVPEVFHNGIPRPSTNYARGGWTRDSLT